MNPPSSGTARGGTADSYLDFRIRPQRLQAWREVNELKDRELMRGGQWLVPA
jgi:hypothetical protein